MLTITPWDLYFKHFLLSVESFYSINLTRVSTQLWMFRQMFSVSAIGIFIHLFQLNIFSGRAHVACIRDVVDAVAEDFHGEKLEKHFQIGRPGDLFFVSDYPAAPMATTTVSATAVAAFRFRFLDKSKQRKPVKVREANGRTWADDGWKRERRKGIRFAADEGSVTLTAAALLSSLFLSSPLFSSPLLTPRLVFALLDSTLVAVLVDESRSRSRVHYKCFLRYSPKR